MLYRRHIMYFTPFSLIYQVLLAAFLSGAGRHNFNSFAKDIGIDKLHKASAKAKGEVPHDDIAPVISNIANLLTSGGLKFPEGLAVKLIESSINNFLNSKDSNIPLSEINTSITNNATQYLVTKAHVGKPTSKRLKNLISTPLVQFNKKDISHSEKDYLEHGKRKNLILNCGFNEKGFAYLLEDNYMSVRDFIKFYQVDPSIEENLLKIRKGKHDTYGAIYNTHNKLTFTNDMKYYDIVMKLHMVKIKDLHNDPRQLIRDTTNNASDVLDITTLDTDTEDRIINEMDKEVEDLKNYTDSRATYLRSSKSSGTIQKFLKDSLKASNISKKVKRLLMSYLNTSFGFRSNSSSLGKIPEEDQYTDPKYTEYSNKFSCNYITSLTTNLNDSIAFRDRATIVSTWNRRISPGSTWEFNLTHHYGKGLHLNYLYDVKSINEDYPVGYIFIVEFFGDKRSKITRVSDEDCFNGYSPVKLRCQFAYQLSYLGKENDDTDEDIPVVYKRKRQEKDFNDNSPLNSYFSPERQPYLHIPIEEIDLVIGKSRKDQKPKTFVLEYDQNILPSTSFLEQLQVDFTKHNFTGTVTEDDSAFNIKNPPSEKEKPYEGTEGQPGGPPFND